MSNAGVALAAATNFLRFGNSPSACRSNQTRLASITSAKKRMETAQGHISPEHVTEWALLDMCEQLAAIHHALAALSVRSP
jgi:hypothetical protein